MKPVWSLLVVFAAVTFVPSGSADPVAYPDRASTYPAGVLNVTHAPWSPPAGDDVTVTVTLDPAHDPPAAAGLLFCRVEPNYACGLGVEMEPSSDATVWIGHIAWHPDFMTPETVHVGYNITLYLGGPEGEERKRTVPLGNHWVPDTYPTEVDGSYYFYAIGPAAESVPSPTSPLVVGLFMLLCAAWRRR
ncbi:MAG: hypothetical protein KY455_01165 [Euryarchaeota archaeon]|nr:hypothetical protein [Euryarchaeota archaeon]